MITADEAYKIQQDKLNKKKQIKIIRTKCDFYEPEVENYILTAAKNAISYCEYPCDETQWSEEMVDEMMARLAANGYVVKDYWKSNSNGRFYVIKISWDKAVEE